MPEDNSVGILTGLVFVAVFLVMLATLSGVSNHIHRTFYGPAPHFVLAGESRPAK